MACLGFNVMVNAFSITASTMLEYLFCPRFTFFEYVIDIPQKEENRFKVQKGRKIHEKIRKTNPDYLRNKLGVIEKKSDVYLSNDMGLRGIVDEILFLKDHTAAPLDYKYAEYKRLYETYHLQLIYYAKLITDNFNIPVVKAYIVYTRSKNKLIEIEIKEKDFAKLDKIVISIHNIITHGHYPDPTKYKKRCMDCCYKNICES